MNQGFGAVGSAINFEAYVNKTYKPAALQLLAKTTQDSYEGTLNKHLLPAFGKACLRDLSRGALQAYFVGLAAEGVQHPTLVKVRDVLSSVLRSAAEQDLLPKNPVAGLKLPPDKRGRRPAPTWDPRQLAPTRLRATALDNASRQTRAQAYGQPA